MSTYSGALENIQKTLSKLSDLLKDSYLQNIDWASALNPLQESIEKMTEPYHQLTESFVQTSYAPFSELVQRISKEFYDSLNTSFEFPLMGKTLSESFQQAMASCFSSDFLESIEALKESVSEDLCDTTDNDFVTVDESAINEYEIPDSIAIPAGNKRVRIKTDFFITLLVTIILWFASVAIDEYHRTEDSQAQLAAEKRQSERDLMEIDILNKILQSVDSSASTKNEAIQNLKEGIQAHDSAIAELRESDQAQNKRIEALESSDHTGQCSCDTENVLENTGSKQ